MVGRRTAGTGIDSFGGRDPRAARESPFARPAQVEPSHIPGHQPTSCASSPATDWRVRRELSNGAVTRRRHWPFLLVPDADGRACEAVVMMMLQSKCLPYDKRYHCKRIASSRLGVSPGYETGVALPDAGLARRALHEFLEFSLQRRAAARGKVIDNTTQRRDTLAVDGRQAGSPFLGK